MESLHTHSETYIYVNILNLIPAEAVGFKAQLDKFLGDRLYEIS